MDLGVISSEPVSVSIGENVSMGSHHFVRAEDYFWLDLSEPIDGHSGYKGLLYSPHLSSTPSGPKSAAALI